MTLLENWDVIIEAAVGDEEPYYLFQTTTSTGTVRRFPNVWNYYSNEISK